MPKCTLAAQRRWPFSISQEEAARLESTRYEIKDIAKVFSVKPADIAASRLIDVTNLDDTERRLVVHDAGWVSLAELRQHLGIPSEQEVKGAIARANASLRQQLNKLRRKG